MGRSGHASRDAHISKSRYGAPRDAQISKSGYGAPGGGCLNGWVEKVPDGCGWLSSSGSFAALRMTAFSLGEIRMTAVCFGENRMTAFSRREISMQRFC